MPMTAIVSLESTPTTQASTDIRNNPIGETTLHYDNNGNKI